MYRMPRFLRHKTRLEARVGGGHTVPFEIKIGDRLVTATNRQFGYRLGMQGNQRYIAELRSEGEFANRWGVRSAIDDKGLPIVYSSEREACETI